MADFNEVAEQLRIFTEQLKESLETEDLRPEHFRFAQNLTSEAQKRTQQQQEFAESLKEEELINRQIDLFKRKQGLEAQRKLVTTKQETDALTRQIVSIDELLSDNEDLVKAVNQQVAAWGKATGFINELDARQERQLTIALEVAAIQQQQTSLTGQQLEDRLEALRVEESHVSELRRGTTEIKKQERARKSMLDDMQVFGRRIGDMRKDFKDIATAPGAIGKALLVAIGVALIKLNQTMQALLNTGLSVGQTFGAIGQTINVMLTGGIDNLLAWKDTFAAVQGLRSQFADISFQTNDMVENTQDLVTFFRLTGAEAAQVTEVLTKVGGLSAQQQDDFQRSARAFAKINDLNPAAVMRLVAQNAEQFALSGARGADEFIRASAAAERLGISLQEIQNIRRGFLDINKVIQQVTTLRQFGINIQDPASLMRAAQFEGHEGFVRELQRQLQGTGRELSRRGLGGEFQVQMVEKLLGTTLDRANRILREGATAYKEPTDELIAEQKGFTEQVGAGLTRFVGSIDKATLAMIAFTAIIGKDLLFGIGRAIFGGGFGGGFGRVAARFFGAAGPAAVAGGGAAARTGAQLALPGLGAAVAPTAAAGIGGRALGALGRVGGGSALKGAGAIGLGAGALFGAFKDIRDIADERRGPEARARGAGGLVGGVIGGGLGLFGGPFGVALGASIGQFVGRKVGDVLAGDHPEAEAIEAQARKAMGGDIPPSAVSDAAIQLAATQQAQAEANLRAFQEAATAPVTGPAAQVAQTHTELFKRMVDALERETVMQMDATRVGTAFNRGRGSRQ